MVETERSPLLPAVIVLVMSFAVYANTLANGFVYDDMTQVLENRWIRDTGHLRDIFSKSVWSFQGNVDSNYYRPLMHVIYMANYHLFGLQPWGFHLVNVLFHAGVSVLVFFTASRLGAGAGGGMAGLLSLPFIAALLFAVHPIHTEPVAWVAGLPDLSFTFFFLLSFTSYIRSTAEKPARVGPYSLSIVSYALAVLCKEPALTLPGLLILYDLAADRDRSGSPIQFRRYVPYLVVAAAYLILRSYALGSFAPVMPYRKLATYDYIINLFPLFCLYLGKLLFPVGLNAFHVLHPIASPLEFMGIVGVIVTAAYIAFTVVAHRKNRTAFLGLVIIAVPLLPAFSVPAFSESAISERYLYLPSVGFVVLVAMFLVRMKQKTPRYGHAAILSAMFLTALYSIQTVGRNTVWKDDLTLFTDTVKKSPDAAIPRKELGIALAESGRVEEAIASYEKAIAMDPSDFRVYNNRGLAFHQMGRVDLAMADFDRAIALNPRSCEAYNNKGKVYGDTGSFDKAIAHFSKAIEIHPDFPLAYGNRGLAYSILGDYPRAWKDINRAIELDDRYAEAYGARGEIYLRTGNTELAASDFRKACNLGNPAGCRALQALLLPMRNRGKR